MKFSKPPRSIEHQIELLTERGLLIPDTAHAAQYLSHINYYRLRGYWIPFEEEAADGDHRFKEGATFDGVLSLYLFDRYLRLWLMDLIERFEVSLRTQWAYAMAMRYGSHAYLKPDLFADRELYDDCMESLDKELEASREAFVLHYRDKYTDPARPPIWAACELLTLGRLSKWFSNLKLRADREAVAEKYGIDELMLCSFVRHLNFIRNICAHHGRIWNRRFTFTHKLPKYPRRLAEQFNRAADRQLYNTLVMLGYLMQKISPESEWRRHLINLIEQHQQVRPEAMGFPEGWRNLEMWSD